MAKAKKLDSGNWRIRVYIGTDATGKKMYKSITKPTKKQAELAALEMQMYSQKQETPEEYTVSEAIDQYLDLKKNILSPTTISGYKSIKRNNLQSLMPVKLSKLTQIQIQKAINDESATLSPKSVRNAHGLLSAVLDEYYPAFVLKTKLPQKVKYIPQIPDAEAIPKLFEIVKNTEIELPVLLGLWLGLRMSEILGLKKEDLQGNLLHIRRALVTVDKKQVLKDTKTYTSTRTIPAPEYIVNLINNVVSKNDFLINLSGQAIYKRLSRLCEKNNLPHYRFHDLRHANASIMLMLGVPDKYAMERTGHATTNMLKTVYQHTMTSEKEKINNIVNNYFENMINV